MSIKFCRTGRHCAFNTRGSFQFHELALTKVIGVSGKRHKIVDVTAVHIDLHDHSVRAAVYSAEKKYCYVSTAAVRVCCNFGKQQQQ